MNKILKRNTGDEENQELNVGGFKIVPNIIGVLNVVNTTQPEEVEKEIDKLLKDYNSKKNITLEDIIDFHYKFERIHPFDDENEYLRQKMIYLQNLQFNSSKILI